MKRIYIALAMAVMAILATSPIQAATEISVVALPNPVQIPEILFTVALCGFALWKKDWIRLLLSLCIIIWGVFFMGYDIKFAAPLVTLGAVLFIAGVFTRIQHAREEM